MPITLDRGHGERYGEAIEVPLDAWLELLRGGTVVVNGREITPDDAPFHPIFPTHGEELEQSSTAYGQRGGPGSGHFGHAGRPGEVGGSLPSGRKSGALPSLENIRWQVRRGGKVVTFDSLAEALMAGEGRIEITDDERALWASVVTAWEDGTLEGGYSPGEIEVEIEIQRVLDVYDHMVAILSDPDNEAMILGTDRDGDSMLDVTERWIKRLQDLREQGEVDRLTLRRAPGMNIIITNNPERVGAGSSSMGSLSAKVFWEPTTLDPAKRHTSTGGGFNFGISPIYVLIHELHHGFGSGTELDAISDVIAADYYMSRPETFTPAIERNMLDTLNGRVFGASRRASGAHREFILQDRAAMGWLYSRNRDYFDRVFSEVREYAESGDPPTERARGWTWQVDQTETRLQRWAREYGQ